MNNNKYHYYMAHIPPLRTRRGWRSAARCCRRPSCRSPPPKVLHVTFTLLDSCVSSLRRGHANLLCIVPSLTDDPRRDFWANFSSPEGSASRGQDVRVGLLLPVCAASVVPQHTIPSHVTPYHTIPYHITPWPYHEIDRRWPIVARYAGGSRKYDHNIIVI